MGKVSLKLRRAATAIKRAKTPEAEDYEEAMYRVDELRMNELHEFIAALSDFDVSYFSSFSRDMVKDLKGAYSLIGEKVPPKATDRLSAIVTGVKAFSELSKNAKALNSFLNSEVNRLERKSR